MEDEGIVMPMKPPLPHPIRHHLPTKPHSSMQNAILNISGAAAHSSAYGDNANKFGELSRRPSVIGNAPVHTEKLVPASFDLMAAFPVR